MTYLHDPEQLSGRNRIGWHDGIDGVRLVDNYLPEGVTFTNAEVLEEAGNYYGPAVGDRVFLRLNQYDPKRATVTIYNQKQSETIPVKVPFIGSVKIRNVQDYFSDIQEKEVENETIEISMLDHTVAAPLAWEAPASTFPEFGAFLLELM